MAVLPLVTVLEILVSVAVEVLPLAIIVQVLLRPPVRHDVLEPAEHVENALVRHMVKTEVILDVGAVEQAPRQMGRLDFFEVFQHGVEVSLIVTLDLNQEHARRIGLVEVYVHVPCVLDVVFQPSGAKREFLHLLTVQAGASLCKAQTVVGLDAVFEFLHFDAPCDGLRESLLAQLLHDLPDLVELQSHDLIQPFAIVGVLIDGADVMEHPQRRF